jgi:hypothetical protein
MLCFQAEFRQILVAAQGLGEERAAFAYDVPANIAQLKQKDWNAPMLETLVEEAATKVLEVRLSILVLLFLSLRCFLACLTRFVQTDPEEP